MMKPVADELNSIVDLVLPMLVEIKNESDLAVRPRPKKWSRKEILGHLIDSACNNQQKFVRVMQFGHIDFPGYAQDEWVDLQDWIHADWDNMVLLWQSYNRHIAYLIENVADRYLKNTVTIEGVGPFTLEFIMPDYVEHLKHHVKQIFPEMDLENKFQNVYGV